ncbi:hypothetical protein CROQUDRAFT_53609 [Cronartium quercuum f. sp. fusiforme G11]|uniref:Carbonic anhydrase n=1 Tax=Cronartium quercuum f. sp. fusiforme G11 TaxID=708437 RepID=A0A9P6N683_9BASI|nr:hypothetical protein CROQUDRAFT_53609 [Cronartium quercuum f. sp. fusiforme G11]
MSNSKENPNSFTVSAFLDRNGHFASQCDPQTLAAGVEGQTPILFWLGCSDSRVPEGLVIRAGLGEVFVHRNVANLFTPGDTSALAAVAYAINVLKVPHIAVVGHENCGGCAAGLAAATAPAPTEPTSCVGMQAIQKWIEPIRQLALAELQKDEKTDLSRVVTANVVAQVANLADNPVIKDAWGRGQSVCVYGWVYDLATGKINDLNVTRTGN